jgi:hypothetical protein
MRIIPDGVETGDMDGCIRDAKGKFKYVAQGYDERDTIEITDIKWRPESWPKFVKYFEDRPKDMSERDLWEFGANSILKAMMELKRP